MKKRLGLLSLFSVLALLMAMMVVPALADIGPPAALEVAVADTVVAPITAEVAAPATGIPLFEMTTVGFTLTAMTLAFVFRRSLYKLLEGTLRLLKQAGSKINIYVANTDTEAMAHANARSHPLLC